ncbi:hypothetical protein [Pseudodesulfovibrio sp. zrk46]|uniref:hypothetical protein n=1 Tax=Pseudodesulfovibrio sp. zrk46 TaxID=2725288 RepID=UPI0014496C87|nr:hypothetical protein [Pseudodesulfovibrio sp. zrk46]QJB56817.1 hypothetical protein HFN16_10545 [Pseudodesulfovibrio sp. zrk46]
MNKMTATASVFWVVVFLMTFALHALAEEAQDAPVYIRGLVVSSGNELLINDGAQDFILLGVEPFDYEGKICEAFGVIGSLDEMPTIKVRTITIIADEYPDDDLVGMNGRIGSSQFDSALVDHANDCLFGSVGITMLHLSRLSLPIWEGSGMRKRGRCDRQTTACRFQHSSKLRTI